jgi:hypothetical protein
MAKRPVVTPADAKAVWDTFEKPTARGVAKALNASGKYEPVTFQSIARWAKRGFPPVDAELSASGRSAKKGANTKAKIDAALPVVTGDPKTRVDDLITGDPNDPKATPLQQKCRAWAQELGKKDKQDLHALAIQEAEITTIVVARLMRENPEAVVAMPRDMGALQAALCGSLGQIHEMMRSQVIAVAEAHGMTLEPDPYAKVVIGLPAPDAED